MKLSKLTNTCDDIGFILYGLARREIHFRKVWNVSNRNIFEKCSKAHFMVTSPIGRKSSVSISGSITSSHISLSKGASTSYKRWIRVVFSSDKAWLIRRLRLWRFTLHGGPLIMQQASFSASWSLYHWCRHSPSFSKHLLFLERSWNFEILLNFDLAFELENLER